MWLLPNKYVEGRRHLLHLWYSYGCMCLIIWNSLQWYIIGSFSSSLEARVKMKIIKRKSTNLAANLQFVAGNWWNPKFNFHGNISLECSYQIHWWVKAIQLTSTRSRIYFFLILGWLWRRNYLRWRWILSGISTV